MTEEQSTEKFSLHLSQCSVLLYDLSYFSVMSVGTLLCTTVAKVPMLPVAENASTRYVLVCI